MKISRSLRAFVLLAVAAGGFAAYRLNSPYQGFEGETYVDIPHGMPASKIADTLAEAGVIRSRWDLLLARLARRGRKLQAGEYRFDGPESPVEVYGRIARGDVFYHELVIPEGRNMFDIAAAASKLGLFSVDRFLEAARNPEMIRDLDPRAPTLEGYLFPNTYRVGRHTTPEQLCRMMTGKFREEWRSLHTDASVHDIVTLASLIEREGKLESDRPLIAAVFENRLRIGMKLDCDPTTIYAALLDDRYRGAIYRSDLERDSPYNTYRRAGLPPGPIANPGLASIEAALHPAESRALYFVLRPGDSGAHQFSTGLAEHEQAIAKYRRAKRK
jgi:peptidoglycan lytic transglycosylase G